MPQHQIQSKAYVALSLFVHELLLSEHEQCDHLDLQELSAHEVHFHRPHLDKQERLLKRLSEVDRSSNERAWTFQYQGHRSSTCDDVVQQPFE